MPVNHEVKGNLARLLATEDLVVEHKKVETACFNVHTRVLTLPMWEKASSAIYDMLVGHEVGHALFTPDDDWWETCKVPKQFVNVVEDVRVEKLMKRKYAGLNKTFYNGYSELNDQDFFAIGDEDVNEYNLADKVNLFYKIGTFLDINFTEEENELVDMIGQTETFADVLLAAEELYNYCKQKQDEMQKISSMNSHDQVSFPGGSEEQEKESEENNSSDDNNSIKNNTGSSTQQSDSSDQDEENNGSQMMDEKSSSTSGGHTSALDVKTAKSLEEAIGELVSKNGTENIYVEIPKLNLNTVIISNSDIHKECSDAWKNTIEMDQNTTAFDVVDKKYMEFKRSAQKEVSYLVKEFECRKSADAYARASTSRTGVLDCSKLHTYKYNDDLFKKVTTLANGKNHGLIFILDWSGSMSEVIVDTIKQLYNLIWFCKKVNIPFDVYAFTNDWNSVTYDEDGKPQYPKKHYEPKENFLCVDESFSLLNILTSKVNGSVLEQQLKNIFRVAYSFERYSGYSNYHVPYKLGLSGTPLNQSLIALHQIIPHFKKVNKLQKAHCIILTDGEGEYLKRHVSIQRRYGSEPYIGVNSINYDHIFLRDRKTGNTYRFLNGSYDITDILLNNLRDSFPYVSFIGIRVIGSRDVSTFVRKYYGYNNYDEYSKVMNDWKKNRSFSIKTSGYHSYFGISSNALNSTTEFQVHGDATKVQIKTAFAKSLASKKMNKKVLSEFVELVA